MAKATKKQVLGRGLETILKDSKNKPSSISNLKTNYSTEIEVSNIILNPFSYTTLPSNVLKHIYSLFFLLL